MSQNRADRAAEYIPVSIRISLEESPFWGRITALSPKLLELTSKFELKKGRSVSLNFDMASENYEDIRGTVITIEKDTCGYFHYSIKLSDENQRSLMQTKLLEALSKI